jgi:tetratricopeptide (TPR) repeat protein
MANRALAAVLVAGLLLAGCGADETAPREMTAAETQRRAQAAAKAEFFARTRAAAKARKGGDLEGAVRLYRDALEQDPEHEGALVDLARTLRELGREAEALATLERLREVRPELPRPHFLIAEMLSERSEASAADLTRSVALYEQALEIEPNVSGPRLGLARAQHRRGRLEDAEAAYRTVLGTNPVSQEALTGLGRVLIDRDRAEAAVPHLLRSLEVGTKAKGRRDVPSEMDTATSFDAATLDAPANRAALEALARAARALGGYPDSVPARFRLESGGR